jgi:hypothetical protein
MQRRAKAIDDGLLDFSVQFAFEELAQRKPIL